LKHPATNASIRRLQVPDVADAAAEPAELLPPVAVAVVEAERRRSSRFTSLQKTKAAAFTRARRLILTKQPPTKPKRDMVAVSDIAAGRRRHHPVYRIHMVTSDEFRFSWYDLRRIAF